MLDQATLKQYVHYDPETGVFTRLRVDSSQWQHRVGQPIDNPKPDGYISTSVQGKEYRLHRLAWLYITGGWPKHGVDHKDRNRSNNRWENLREATQLQQIGNMSRYGKGSKSGVRGVHPDASGKRWVAHIRLNGKQLHLGSYDTIEEAKTVYEAAARAKFGEFYSPWSDPSPYPSSRQRA